MKTPLELAEIAIDHLCEAQSALQLIQQALPVLSQREIGNSDEVLSRIEQALDCAQDMRGNIQHLIP